MADNYKISFIAQNDFEKHVAKTIANYNETLKSINLNKFNSNIVDPIKLTFDKALFKKSIVDVSAFSGSLYKNVAKQFNITNDVLTQKKYLSLVDSMK